MKGVISHVAAVRPNCIRYCFSWWLASFDYELLPNFKFQSSESRYFTFVGRKVSINLRQKHIMCSGLKIFSPPQFFHHRYQIYNWMFRICWIFSMCRDSLCTSTISFSLNSQKYNVIFSKDHSAPLHCNLSHLSYTSLTTVGKELNTK